MQMIHFQVIKKCLVPTYYINLVKTSQITSPEKFQNNHTFQVIGAGLSRTGTFSTRIGKVYFGHLLSIFPKEMKIQVRF